MSFRYINEFFSLVFMLVTKRVSLHYVLGMKMNQSYLQVALKTVSLCGSLRRISF